MRWSWRDRSALNEMDLSQVAQLSRGQDDIWRATKSSPISYPETGNKDCLKVEDSSFWFSHRNACIIKVINNFMPGGALLDIGGGNGFVSQALQKSGVEAVVLEPGLIGARNAKSRGIRDVICATFTDAGFAPGSIVAAGLFDVLEHIEDDRGFLRTIRSGLIPGGRLYITVPAFNWLWSSVDQEAGHYRRYTLGGLCALLKGAEYEVEYATYFFSFLPLPILLARVVPYRLGIRRAPESDHCASSSISAIGRTLMARELSRIGSREKLLFGGSCLVVARRSQVQSGSRM